MTSLYYFKQDNTNDIVKIEVFIENRSEYLERKWHITSGPSSHYITPPRPLKKIGGGDLCRSRLLILVLAAAVERKR